VAEQRTTFVRERVGDTDFFFNIDGRGSVLIVPVGEKQGLVFSAEEWADITKAIKEGQLDGQAQ
jgi:hypothetical protein